MLEEKVLVLMVVLKLVIMFKEVLLIGVFRNLVVLTVTPGGRALVCAGAVSDKCVEVLAVDM